MDRLRHKVITVTDRQTHLTQTFNSVCRTVGKFNWLHVRTDAKLRNKEVLATIRARALLFIQYFQPMMLLAKSTKLKEGGGSLKYLEQAPYIKKALEFATTLETSPRLLLDRSLQIFDFNSKLCALMDRYCNCKKNKPMVDYLFKDTYDDEDVILPIIRACGTALRKQLLTGSTNKFLGKEHGAEVDGEYLHPTEKQKLEMSNCDMTTDKIEGMFGKIDNVLSTNSVNVSFHSAAALTCWQANNTTRWLEGLSVTQRQTLIKLSRRNGPQMARDSRQSIVDIAEARRVSMKDVAAKRLERLKTKITKTLALDSDARQIHSRMTVKAFDEFEKNSKSTASTVKEIKLNIMCLKTFYNFKQKDLIAYSAARIPFPDDNIIRQYRKLLRRIEQKELVIGKMVSALDSVLYDAHVFREGTLSASAKRLEAERIESIKVCVCMFCVRVGIPPAEY